MKLYAVIGHPVAHSKSPLMFNSYFKRKNIDAWYSRIASINFRDALETCKILNISGINITMPYKKDALGKVDYISDEAKEVEGVNTLLFNNELKGYNTDIYGVTNSLKVFFRSLKNKRILVIGAGGAARAALYGCRKEGAICFIANRSKTKGLYVSRKFNADFLSFKDINNVLEKIDAIVYTIPVEIDINIFKMKDTSVFLSAIYKQHFFKKECEERGITYIPGEKWLIEQGRVSCNLFGFNCGNNDFGMFDNSGKPAGKISLIGFMGSGKSSVGKVLAEKLNYTFLDLDREIEVGEGMDIPLIFKKFGEGYFRELERRYLRKFENKDGIVISTGGGIVENSECRKVLNQSFFNVFLCGDLKEFYRRTSASGRPLRGDFKGFESIYSKRLEYYFKLSDLIVNSSNKAMETTANTIYYEISKI